MANVIDAVKPTDVPELTGLARDAQTIKQASWNVVNACRLMLQTVQSRAGIHGLNALKAALTAEEQQAVVQTIQTARQVLTALGPDYDPGEILVEPLPPPPAVEEP